MSRVIGGVLVLLLATPVLWAEDKPREKEKDRPAATPAEQYKALLAEYQKANKAFMVTVEAAKTTEERIKLFREKNPRQKFAPRFVELAQKNPKDPVAVDALIWVVTGSGGGTATKDQARAVDLLIRDHVQSDKLVRCASPSASGSTSRVIRSSAPSWRRTRTGPCRPRRAWPWRSGCSKRRPTSSASRATPTSRRPTRPSTGKS